ncbi:MAG TPA: trypsin-like peptidase domain-containing protein [Flavobacteriales bacterium]|nr:trypsin-like peptidase domain-containing protein [Flavobacteriales bacterium]
MSKANGNLKQAFGYLGMAVAGGLLALGLHDRFQPKGMAQTVGPASSIPTHYVSQPVDNTTSVAAPDFIAAASKSVDAVVHVTTEATVQQAPMYNFFWGYQQRPPQQVRGAGSGVIISDDGYIVTNNHVVEGADKIQVHLNDKRKFEATMIGRDPSTDIALIKVTGEQLPVLAFANSDDVKVGQWALAVGNPMNLTSTVTAGIVSALARNINILQYDPTRDVFPIESFIQTDAAVNPGNSGGALVNTNGDLIGINSAIASTTGSYTGYSFAVPSNIVSKVTHDLMEFGHVRRAYLGVTISDIDQDMAKNLDLKRLNGVYVKDVVPNGAAKKAGMQGGDVIVKVGTIPVNNVPELQGQISKFSPGDKVAITLLRKGNEMVKELTLLDRGGEDGSAPSAELTMPSLGADLAPATADELGALRIEGGVKVVRLSGGKLRSIGIKEGFIITKVDQQQVKAPKDIERAINNKQGGILIEGVYPNGKKAYYGLGM